MRTSLWRACLAMVPLAVLTADLNAGTIVGTIRGRGAPEIPGDANGGSYGSRRYKFAERIDYDSLRDFVISIDQPVPGAKPADDKEPSVVQKDVLFEPHVLAIAVGTKVKWPNEDDIYHNIYSIGETKDFNLGLYGKEKVPEITFDKVGRVDVFCAIHAQMHCIILVLPNPYFAVADARGRFTIRDVPAGSYKLKGWHERLPSKTVEVVVPAEGEVKVDFVLGLPEVTK